MRAVKAAKMGLNLEPTATATTAAAPVAAQPSSMSSGTVAPAAATQRWYPSRSPCVSWKDDGNSGGSLLQHAQQASQQHQQQQPKSPVDSAAIAAAAADAHVRAQRRAAQEASVSRLANSAGSMLSRSAGARQCLNPAHEHGPRLIRMGVTEIGSRFPLEDPNSFGEGLCVFSSTTVDALKAAHHVFPMPFKRDAPAPLQHPDDGQQLQQTGSNASHRNTPRLSACRAAT
jgi:hypothetical protein